MMQQIVRINLENEMDLILAHKRSMKLSELCGLSVASQTTFATAVSEIARCAISYGTKSYLVLGINPMKANKKQIIASIFDQEDLSNTHSDALNYAKRLMGKLDQEYKDGLYEIRLQQHIPYAGTISPSKMETFKEYFKNEVALSPYDELRKKNIHLIELSEKLKESENQYKQLTDTLPQMMFSTNANGTVTFSNRGLKEYLASQNISDVNLFWKSMIHPDDYSQLATKWSIAQSTKTAFSTQTRLVSKDKNSSSWHLLSLAPIKNEQDQVTKWTGFFVDIQAEKKMEAAIKDNQELKETKLLLEHNQEQLEDKVRQLNISNHDLEQFAYIASHDLQEPLRKIQTFSMLLKKAKDDDNAREKYLDKVISSTTRMSELIKAVLHYSRVSNVNDEFIPIDLVQLISALKDDFELIISEKNAKIEIGELPKVEGVKLQLHQLFYNLVSNALKFSATAPLIKITARVLLADEVKELTKKGARLNYNIGYAEVVVSDNGIGFEQRYADKIFTIFQRLNDRESYSGTGIGLALCRKIVEKHGGYITAQSEIGSGATFYIYLPLAVEG